MLTQTLLRAIFRIEGQHYALRNGSRLKIPKVQTKSSIETASSSGWRLWNNLPKECKESQKINEPKNNGMLVNAITGSVKRMWPGLVSFTNL